MGLQGNFRSGHIGAKLAAWSAAAVICSGLFEAGCGGNSRQLLSLQVAPVMATTTLNESVLFVLVGTYNRAPLTLDESASWTSSDPSIASIDATSGIATCSAVGGPITITAPFSPSTNTASLTCSQAPSSGGGACVPRGGQCAPKSTCCAGLVCAAASTRAFCEPAN